jgi:hypothetical protein
MSLWHADLEELLESRRYDRFHGIDRLDWPAYPQSDPIRWRPCVDPGQKHDPVTDKGIDKSGPVTEAHLIQARRVLS